MSISAVASAPGKTILFGEHAVVYGIPAIAVALSDLRISAEIHTVENNSDLSITFGDLFNSDGNPSTVVVPLEKLEQLVPNTTDDALSPKSPDEAIQKSLAAEFSNHQPSISQAMPALVYLIAHIVYPKVKSLSSVGISAKIKSVSLPIGAGLGSSAAFNVALAAACLRLYSKLQDPTTTSTDIPSEYLDIINAWAFIGEVLIHGTPSGLDNTTSTFGGMLQFTRKETGANEFAKLTNVSNLNILLINTKVPRSTKALVAGVRVLHDTFPEIVLPIFKSIQEITHRFLQISSRLQNKEMEEAEGTAQIETLIRINQALLNGIGVGHRALDSVVDIANQHQCVGKLTGAGGGGCAIILINETKLQAANKTVEDLVNALKDQGFDVFRSSVGGNGVQWVE